MNTATIMTADRRFVPVPVRGHTLLDAMFQSDPHMVRARTQSANGDGHLRRHLPVTVDLLASVVDVIVVNQLVFIDGQRSQTLPQAFSHIVVDCSPGGALRQDVSRNFLAAVGFTKNVSRHAVKVAHRFVHVFGANLRQTFNNAIYSFVGVMFRVGKAVGDKDSNQATTYEFILSRRFIALQIQPIKQRVE